MNTAPRVGYHTRLDADQSVKLTGGSFGGALSMETANRLVKSHFMVGITPTGRPVFVDEKGRLVSLYMRVDPAETDAGKAVLAAHRAEKRRRDERLAEEMERDREEIDDLMDGMTPAEIIRRLKGA